MTSFGEYPTDFFFGFVPPLILFFLSSCINLLHLREWLLYVCVQFVAVFHFILVYLYFVFLSNSLFGLVKCLLISNLIFGTLSLLNLVFDFSSQQIHFLNMS